MRGGVCDLPNERCYHPISCEVRGCVKQRSAPTPAPLTTPAARSYTEEACPVCEGKPVPSGSWCMAGCREGIVLTTSANVLRNVMFWYRAQERELSEARMTPERQEAIRQAARKAVGDNTSLHAWHVIDETIAAIRLLSQGGKA